MRTSLGLHARDFGRTARRVVLAILLTATIPLLVQLFVGRAILARISATAFQPEFGAHLDRALGVYADLAKALKSEMRAEGHAIAARLAPFAARRGDLPAQLDAIIAKHPTLVSIGVAEDGGDTIAHRERDKPLDPKTERSLTVTLPIEPGGDASPLVMTAVFATPSARFDEMDEMQDFEQAYRQLEQQHRAEYVDDTYNRLFLVVLGGTILLAIAAGVLVVRPVTRRIAALAAATVPVAHGDLSVRFPEAGDDEVGELGRAFNRMLGELDQSRERIEFLRRMGEWQKVARRLAHEIKNPLTPIQLAVEECHRRYDGDDAGFRRILDTTLEVVEEEIGTLRRLVGEFSSFARLPRADLREEDLGVLFREQEAHLEPSATGAPDGEGDAALLSHVTLEFAIDDGPMPALVDREMLHRVVLNVVRNAAQALRDARRGESNESNGSGRWGRVRVSAKPERDAYAVDIDDDGPGIAPDVAKSLFDPYVTTKRDGTGLGLSIVKKIVVDHGGTIEALASPLGGARFRIRLPRPGAATAREALERSRAASEPELPPSSRRPAAVG